MEVMALIPARGGSKSIPYKNLYPVAGKPLIAYSIEDALATCSIDRIIVSTDDDKIAQVAREYGAEIPFMRPASIAQDHSTDWDVFNHALHRLREQEAYQPDLVVHLRPTTPIRRPDTMAEAIALLAGHPEADSLRSVEPTSQTPYKMWRIEEGVMQPLIPMPEVVEIYNRPRQALSEVYEVPTVYSQNGYIDITRPRVVLDRGLMNGDVILPFVIREKIADIDYVEDVALAEEIVDWRRKNAGKVLYADDRIAV